MEDSPYSSLLYDFINFLLLFLLFHYFHEKGFHLFILEWIANHQYFSLIIHNKSME